MKIRLLLLVLVLVAWPACLPLPEHDHLTVTFIDVGQGAAVLLESPQGTVLFDAGRGSAAKDYLQAHHISDLDLIIASHAHADHVGGFSHILEAKQVDKIWYNGQTHTTQTFERFIDAALSSDATYLEPLRGHTKTFGQLELEVLHPETSAAEYEGHLHDKNIVVMATYGNISFLLTGDAEESVEDELIEAGIDVKADVLKMGHHGSRTSSSDKFVEAVAPQLAIYQASETNQYGHPHEEALTSVRAVGARVMGTDTYETIRIRTDGHVVEVEY